MDRSKEQRAEVQRIYNQGSEYYVTSTPHARSSSLARSSEVLNPKGGVLLDVATGGGHVALRMADLCDRVIASDLTAGMIAAAKKHAAEKGAKNVSFLRTDAENLGVADASLDWLSVRIAPHHFADVPRFMREIARSLKPGGRVVYIDNIAPEEPAEADRYNGFEKKRDPSHARCDSLPALVAMMEEANLRVLYSETLRKRMDFDEWVQRPHLTEADVAGLRDFLESPTPAIRYWLQPREEEGRLFFDEMEAVILAERP